MEGNQMEKYPPLMKGLAVGIILLFVGSCIIPAMAQDTEKPLPTSSGNWLYVGGSGPGNYTRIQDAINNAHSSDTIFVYNGTYYGCISISKNNITLIGQDKNTTIIDGSKIQTVLTIGANNCIISSFTLINCRQANNNWDSAVIKIYSDDNTIENNIISCYHIEYNSDMAAIDIEGSNNKIIRNRVFEEDTAGRLHGIVVQSEANYNIISQNNITDYWVDGILILVNSTCNIISWNYIHNNAGAGISDWGEFTTIMNNTISRNRVGVACEIGSHSRICNNIIEKNSEHGIELSWAPNTAGKTYYFVSKNLISDNYIGIYILDSYFNTIEKNDLINNSANAYFIYENYGASHNKWVRNYWSDSRRTLLKFIRGEKLWGGFIIQLQIPWFNIDWFPAQEPYDIEG
jgi:parallel beta-helix repeat protein